MLENPTGMLAHERKVTTTNCNELDAETLLTQQLEALSLAEQEQILMDLHGFAVPDDDKEAKPITAALYLLQTHMDALLNNSNGEKESVCSTAAFLQARETCPAYVQDESFLRLFLHAATSPVQAACQVMHHFSVKQALFGNGPILGRHVRQTDLTPEELALIMPTRSPAIVQVLVDPDAAGRSVWLSRLDVIAANDSDENTRRSMYRAIFYLVMTHLRQQAQDKQPTDVVWVDVAANENNGQVFGQALEALKLMHHHFCIGLPQRVAAGHFCGFDPGMSQQGAAYQLQHFPSTDGSERFRKRYHVGRSWADLVTQLALYGIEIAPETLQGTCLGREKKDWMQRMKNLETEKESQSSNGCTSSYTTSVTADSASSGLSPQNFDVLLGKTKRSLQHKGNRRLEVLCELRYDEYNDTAITKHRKTEISDRIVSMIHDSGGQFLQWQEEANGGDGPASGGWIPVDRLTARNKVSHVFRFLRAKRVKRGSC